MILALLLACSPFKNIEDQWNAAWEACDPDTVEGEPDPYDLDATLSADCQDTLLDDFKVDRDSLAAVAETDTSPALDACFVTSAFTLLSRDAGRFATTEAGDGVFQVYLDQMQEVYWQLGGDDNRQLAYNYAAWFTAGVVVDESFEDGALAGTSDDGLRLAPEAVDECGVELAQVLFHESGHPNLGDHVACPQDFAFTDCPDCTEVTATACDADNQGTFALESSLLALWVGTCDEEAEADTCAYLEEAQGVAEDLAMAF